MASQVEIEIADGAKNLIHKLTMLGVTLTDREKALGKALFRFIATRERWDRLENREGGNGSVK